MLWAVTSWMGPERDCRVRGVEGPRKSGCVSGNTRVGGDFALSCQGKGADLENGHVPRCASQQAKCCVSYLSSCLAWNSNVQSHFLRGRVVSGSKHFLGTSHALRMAALETCPSVALASSPFCSLMVAQHGAEEVEAFFALSTGMGGRSENQDVMLGAPSPREAGSFLWGLNSPAREDGERSQDLCSLSPLGLCLTQRATEGRRVLGVGWSGHLKQGQSPPPPDQCTAMGVHCTRRDSDWTSQNTDSSQLI